jgi:pilus assembly protein CpaB
MAKKKLLIAALVVGLCAALLGWLYMHSAEEKVQRIKGTQVSVVKAARTIPAGTKLTRDQLTRTQVPKRFLPKQHIKAKNIKLYAGRQVTEDVQKGDYLTTGNFSKRNISSELASRVPLKERAMAVPVDNVSGVAGLLQPGDRVDILGTFKTKQQDRRGQEKEGYVTMTLLQNVSLLAVGQRISNINQDGKKGQTKSRGGYGTVTVAVSVEEAELLTIAQTQGELMLLLRNRDQVNITPPKKQTLKQVLDKLDIIAQERVERTKKRIERTGGSAAEEQEGIEYIRGTE